MSNPIDATRRWDIESARALYNIPRWGAKYFDINDAGHVVAKPLQDAGASVDLTDVIEEAKGRGLKFPLLIRFQDILRHRVEAINKAFQNSISEFNYADNLAHPWPSHPQRAPLGRRPGSAATCIGHLCTTAITQPATRRMAKPGTPGRSRSGAGLHPGGAWDFGSRTLQGHALMAHLVRRGWVCLSLEYGTSPQHRWPRQMTDVKAAIAWARANVAEFGGDPKFIVAADVRLAATWQRWLDSPPTTRSGKPNYPLTPTHPSMQSSVCTASTTGRTVPLCSAHD